ncbi:MAG: molybdopterin molybdotransferase MoeA [Desulfosarcina sp.]|nr:molybdopterin molybdotransferase MoeA [Desulfobacterales bacterium]
MKSFFKVVDIDTVLSLARSFDVGAVERVALAAADERVLAENVQADLDIPGFSRSTMDGYAVRGASTFGASEANPAFLRVVGNVAMGAKPAVTVKAGEAVRIATGGMLPGGSDAVIMIEHTETIDAETIEVYKSAAPGQHVISRGEDVRNGDTVLHRGQPLRPQVVGLLAAVGKTHLDVFTRPRVGILSTGDEVVPVDTTPGPAQIRDINSVALAALITVAGGIPHPYGIVPDDKDALRATCHSALQANDMVLISGGSSVGTRDFTIDVLQALEASEILVHGVSIRPGKPTILARSGGKPVWGLPGHVTSAMVVFTVLVRPYLEHLGGLDPHYIRRLCVPARLTRNLPSVQGRIDYVRVRLVQGTQGLDAEPVLGKSGLIRTMAAADGLLCIDENTEGLNGGTVVPVELF